jgi:hypothetical protein
LHCGNNANCQFLAGLEVAMRIIILFLIIQILELAFASDESDLFPVGGSCTLNISWLSVAYPDFTRGTCRADMSDNGGKISIEYSHDRLYLFDNDGDSRWNHPVPIIRNSCANLYNSVAISYDGENTVAASSGYLDCTIYASIAAEAYARSFKDL